MQIFANNSLKKIPDRVWHFEWEFGEVVRIFEKG
jgi:hypothetical protein